MRLRILAMVPIVLAGVCAYAGPSVLAQGGSEGNKAIIAEPPQGHPHDQIYVSGCCFGKHRSIYVVLACPNWAQSNGYIESVRTKTNTWGAFVNFRIQAIPIPPHKLFQPCQITAGPLSNPYADAIPSPYKIVAPGQPLDLRAIRLRVQLATSPARVHFGVLERITISSWPGARATLTVSFPHAPSWHRTVTLNWRGEAQVGLRIHLHVNHPTPVHVKVSAHVGHSDANGQAVFKVLR